MPWPPLCIQQAHLDQFTFHPLWDNPVTQVSYPLLTRTTWISGNQYDTRIATASIYPIWPPPCPHIAWNDDLSWVQPLISRIMLFLPHARLSTFVNAAVGIFGGGALGLPISFSSVWRTGGHFLDESTVDIWQAAFSTDLMLFGSNEWLVLYATMGLPGYGSSGVPLTYCCFRVLIGTSQSTWKYVSGHLSQTILQYVWTG